MQKKIFAGLITFIAASIAITPYCGWLFDCGCNWPWAGLDANCNNHIPGAVHKCPWCGNYVKGFISTSLTIGTATLITFMPRRHGTTLRLLKGSLAFLIVGFITAWISATIQGYPHFII